MRAFLNVVMLYLSILPLAVILAVILIGGPLTLVAGLRVFNYWFGNIRVRPVRAPTKPEDDAPLGLYVAWDPEARPYRVCRIRLDYVELVPGGRSTSFSFTLEDKAAKKRSFVLPLKLTADQLAILTDTTDAKTLARSTVALEVESTDGQTVRRKLPKAAFIAALAQEPFDAAKAEADLAPVLQADTWGVLTRVFPWRKVVEAVAAAPKEKAAGGAAKTSAPQIFDFIIKKVWIEPGCIVCDACENEAPDVFQVLADTCIVRENAPLIDTGSIVAAADGCPVDVIKYDTAPKSA